MPTLRLLSMLVLLGLPGCTYLIGKAASMGMFGKPSSKDNRMGEAKVVGVVEMVNPEQNYVLINCEQRLNLPPGTEIVAQNADGSKAKLKVSPEHKGNYITADIKEGVPKVRDLVLYQVKPGELPPPPGTPAAAAAAAAAQGAGPVVPLTPIMQADVIPPLDAPFQPMPALNPAAPPPSARLPLQAAPLPAPAPVPEPDSSGLPPVIR